MKTIPFLKSVSLALFFMSFIFIGCNDDDDPSGEAKGNLELSITDAPIDDPEIKATFITVTGVELDGTRFNFDNEVKFDIMAYQRGDTKVLFDEEIHTGTYNDLVLVLMAGENDNQPASYVETKDGMKHDLFSGISGEVKFDVNAKSYAVTEGNSTNLVLDFNVRNAIRHSSNTGEDKYNINSDFSSIIRAEPVNNTLVVSGKVLDPLKLGGKSIVAYLYVKGDFDKEDETSVSGSSGIMFEHALASDMVDGSGNFEFHYVPSKTYEVVLVGYENIDSDSELEVKGFLTTNILGVLGVEINALGGSNINTNITVTGFLGI